MKSNSVNVRIFLWLVAAFFCVFPAEVGNSQIESVKTNPAVVVSKKTPSQERIQKIAVFPTTPFEVYTIYMSLAVFWAVLIGLVIIIKMKLAEIERIQKLGIHKEDINAPLLH
jgi:hypothetical protein